MHRFLEYLGAEGKEVDVYLVLLELGAQPVSVVAKKIKSPRSSTYLILERLLKLGLISTFERSGVKYFMALDPAELEEIFAGKQRKLDNMLDSYKEAVPQLQAIMTKSKNLPLVKYFDGKEAVMRMYEEVLASRFCVAVLNPQLVKEFMPEYHEVIPTALAEKGLEVRELLIPGPAADEYFKKFATDKHQIRFLPDCYKLSTDVIVSENTVYMVAYGVKPGGKKADISAVEIRNSYLVEFQKLMFEGWWGRL